jgi:ribosomal protein S18 acetylase RimI-like enzyme
LGTGRAGCGGAAGAPLISDAGDGDVEVLRALFREYSASLVEQGCFPDFEDELAALPGGYEALLVARVDGEPVGCVAIRRLDDATCEMKRLYVQPDGRGSGLGRALAEAIVDEARRLGFRTMKLDTLPSMDTARALYRSLGFRPVERYNDNPIEGVLFYELTL